MGKKKPVNATVDELHEVRDELQATIDQLRAEAATKAQCQGDRQQLDTQIAALTDRVNQNAARATDATESMGADCKNYADGAADGALGQARGLVDALDAARQEAETALQASIHEVDQGVRSALATELEQLCETLDGRLAEFRQEILGKVELMGSQMAEALVAAQQQGEAARKQDRSLAEEGRAKLRADLSSDLERFRQETQRAQDDIRSKAASDRSELDERLDLLSGSVYQNHCEATSSLLSLRKDTSASMDAYREATDSHLASLDRTAEVLTDGVSEVRHAATRRVEWVIKAASKTLELGDRGEGHSAWLSPRFHAAGARNLQMELRRYPADGGGGAADCALFLWSDKGLSVACRLSVGSRSSTVERVFSERAPHGTKRLCCLGDQIRREDDTLRLGVEMLEVVSEAGAPATLLLDGEASAAPEAAGAGEGPGPFEGSLTCHRHINNRVLPAVRKEVDRMQSRMVKRTEWLLEQASVLPQSFPNRQPICSPVFSAAGVDGMQLLFYPSGYLGSSEGFCALFLYCPAGVTIKAFLSVGKQKREANYIYAEGGAFGRTNFCRWEGLYDEVEDTLLIALEVEECRQDITTTVGDPPAIQGDVKLTRLPGQVGLVDTKVLPSLWSAKGLGDTKAQDAPGFHTFGALKSRAKASSGRPAAAAAEPEIAPLGAAATALPSGLFSGGSPLPRSSSTPLLGPPGGEHTPQRAEMTLPALFATPSGELGGDRSCGSVRTRKSRGSRRPASLVPPPLVAAAPC